MAMSKYLFNQLVDHIFRTATFAKPAHLYMGLFTANPLIDGSGAEVVGGSYGRAQLDPLNTNYLATQGGTAGASSGVVGTTLNAVALTFPAPTANWGTVGWWGMFDAASGGNMILYGPMVNPQVINNGQPAPTIPIGDFSETFQ